MKILHISRETYQEKSRSLNNGKIHQMFSLKLLFSLGNIALNKALTIKCSWTSNIKARLTSPTASDHIKGLLKTLQRLKFSNTHQHIVLKLSYQTSSAHITNN